MNTSSLNALKEAVNQWGIDTIGKGKDISSKNIMKDSPKAFEMFKAVENVDWGNTEFNDINIKTGNIDILAVILREQYLQSYGWEVLFNWRNSSKRLQVFNKYQNINNIQFGNNIIDSDGNIIKYGTTSYTQLYIELSTTYSIGAQWTPLDIQENPRLLSEWIEREALVYGEKKRQMALTTAMKGFEVHTEAFTTETAPSWVNAVRNRADLRGFGGQNAVIAMVKASIWDAINNDISKSDNYFVPDFMQAYLKNSYNFSKTTLYFGGMILLRVEDKVPLNGDDGSKKEIQYFHGDMLAIVLGAYSEALQLYTTTHTPLRVGIAPIGTGKGAITQAEKVVYLGGEVVEAKGGQIIVNKDQTTSAITTPLITAETEVKTLGALPPALKIDTEKSMEKQLQQKIELIQWYKRQQKNTTATKKDIDLVHKLIESFDKKAETTTKQEKESK